MSTAVLMAGALPTYAPHPTNYSVRHDAELPHPRYWVDLRNGGTFKVLGTTAVVGSPDVPVSRRVFLLDWVTLRPVRDEFSAAGSGVYEFANIRSGPWLVLSRDHTGEYNAVAADNIYGESM